MCKIETMELEIRIPDDFYDTCLMETDGRGNFFFFDEDLTVIMTAKLRPESNPHLQKHVFSAYTCFDVAEEFDVDIDRLILRGYQIEATELKSR